MVSQNLVADLYDLRVDDRCAGQGCFFVGRKLTTAFDASRDVLIQDLGKGVTMRMPLARWASRTDQATSVTSGLPRRASALGVSLAAVATTWDTLRRFYPYDDLVRVDWDAELERAVRTIEHEPTPAKTNEALSRMVAALHDDHGWVIPTPAPDGRLPIELRIIDGRAYVVGVSPVHAPTLRIGAEVTALNGVPTQGRIRRMAELTSAATEGWRRYSVGYDLVLGQPGHVARIEFRLPGQVAVQRAILTYLRKDALGDQAREPRPTSGSELASGVVYIDLDRLTLATWDALVPQTSYR